MTDAVMFLMICAVVLAGLVLLLIVEVARYLLTERRRPHHLPAPPPGPAVWRPMAKGHGPITANDFVELLRGPR